MSDSLKHDQVVNEPTEFKNIPIEPPVGDYISLRKAKNISDLTSELHRFPRFAKDYYSILTQNFHDAKPSLDFYDIYERLSKIEDDKTFVEEFTRAIPQTMVQRVNFASTLSQEQLYQLHLLTSRHAMVTLPKAYEEQSKTRTHTINRKIVLNIFDTPNPTEAARVFPTIDKKRREKWFDLTMHHLRVSYSDSASRRLALCFERPHALRRGTSHARPCAIAAQAVDGGYELWGQALEPGNQCGAFTQGLRDVMVETPNYDQARYFFNRIVTCMNTVEKRMTARSELLRSFKSSDILDSNHFSKILPFGPSFYRENYLNMVRKFKGGSDDEKKDE